MARKYDVIGMGNAIVDVLASVSDDFILKHQLVKNAMMLIDEFRAEQLLKAFGETLETPGGSAGNTMAGLASLGASGLYVGKVKNDRLGKVFAAGLMAGGTDFTTKPAEDGPATACSLIAVPPDGGRAMNTYLGASRWLGPADIFESDIANSGILYIEGYLWDSEVSKEASKKAIAIAKSTGTKIAFTLSDSFCVGRYRDDFLKLLDDIDIVFANEDEAKSLFEVDEFDGALQRFKAWNGIAALTRSAKGCVAVGTGGDVHVIDAAPVAAVLDTTGAGDQFAAGFLFGLVRGKDLATCGRIGALAAGEVIGHFGARPETPLRDLAVGLI